MLWFKATTRNCKRSLIKWIKISGLTLSLYMRILMTFSGTSSLIITNMVSLLARSALAFFQTFHLFYMHVLLRYIFFYPISYMCKYRFRGQRWTLLRRILPTVRVLQRERREFEFFVVQWPEKIRVLGCIPSHRGSKSSRSCSINEWWQE